MLTHGSLFSGIGGFDLGFERAGIETVWQVEIEDYCRRVLARHWPAVQRFTDVRAVGKANLPWVDILSGGFPCQDISYAGSGKGLDGERSGLWWEFARIVREMGPRIVVVENVAALLDGWIGDILGTLAECGYDAEWSRFSACSMGATHMRQRVFIVAHANGVDGRPRVWNTDARPFRPLQIFDGFSSARACARERLANPSALYRGADGVAFGMDRNRGIGNSVAPAIGEWIGRRIVEAAAEAELRALAGSSGPPSRT